MRDLTPAEKSYWYRHGRWPCCAGTGYLEGPRGGIMQNIKCPRCGTIMNVIDPSAPEYWRVGPSIGQMIEEPPGYKPPAMPWFGWPWLRSMLRTWSWSA